MPGDTLGGFFITALGLLPVRDPWAEADILGSLAWSRTWPTQDRETAALGRTAYLDGFPATGWQPLFSWLSETADPAGFASAWPVRGTATKSDTGWPGPLPAAGLSGDSTPQTEDWAALLFAFGDTLADRPGQMKSHRLAALESAAAGPEVATLATALTLEKAVGTVLGAPPADTAYAPAASGAGYSLSLAAGWDAGPRFAGRPSANLGLSSSGQPLPAPAAPTAAPPAPAHAVTPETQAQVSHALSQTPLLFEANVGQVDRQVQFLTHGPGYTAFLTATEAVLVLPGPSTATGAHTPRPEPSPLPDRVPDPTASTDTTPPDVVRLQLIGSNLVAWAVGQDRLVTRTNYFIGNEPDNWHTDIPNYGQVVYPGVYPGVDLVYHGSSQQQLEYDFVVAPGADLRPIQLRVQGSHGVRLDAQGNLVVATTGADLVEQAPVIYQEGGGTQQRITGRYVLEGKDEIGFQVDAYDHSQPLVIDPALSYSTYLGGSGDDDGNAIAVDSSGNTYVTGNTTSTNFPTQNPLQATNRGSQNVFVAKLDAAGALLYSTYLGGSRTYFRKGGLDYGNGIAVDPAGNAYVTGYTYSTDFPVQNALQATHKGDGPRGDATDGFVAKLTAAGALVYSTYLSGSGGGDRGFGIAVDTPGNPYVTGFTDSTDFPTANAVQANLGGGGAVNAFVTKLSAAGTDLVYSTYLGGSSFDEGMGITVDAAGNAYVTGDTHSTNFPVANPIQSSPGGILGNAFVTKLNAAGTALVYSTYLGGSGQLFNNRGDGGRGIAVDAAGNASVTGFTFSSNFPTQNPLEAFPDSKTNGSAFVAKLNTAGSALVYSTYLAGSGYDVGDGIGVDNSGNAYVTGHTDSTDWPTQNPLQAALGNSGSFSNAFLSKLNSPGSSLIYSTYLGGCNPDSGNGIAIDNAGDAYVTGATASVNFPTRNALQPSLRGNRNAFIAKISSAVRGGPPPAIPLTFDFSDTGELIKTVPGASGGNPAASAFSESGVRYFDGTIRLVTTDLSSAGFGTAWGQVRSWSNGAGYASNTFNGFGMVDSQLPYVIQDNTNCGNTLVVIGTGTNARYFDYDGNVYVPRFFLQDQLIYNITGQEIVLTDPTGAQTHFYDFSSSLPINQRGQFKSFIDPYGNTTRVVSHTPDGKVKEVQRSVVNGGLSVTESYLYSYLAMGDPNVGLLSNVTLRRGPSSTGPWTTVRQADYQYYDGTQPYGNLGDLKTATIKDGASPLPNVLDSKYYRYYQHGDANGDTHGLKYVFNPQSYARLVSAVGDPTMASDTAVAPYADNYFEYDNQQRVTREVVQGTGSSTSGGVGNYAYSYFTSTNPTDFNKWKVRTTETLPDNNQNIIYTNGYGEVALKVFKDVVNTGNSWLTFYKYDDHGRLILQAAPSAVTGYDENKSDLLNYNSQTHLYQYLNNTAGVILINDFSNSTTADEMTVGDVEGYQQDTKIQRGQQGTAIPQTGTQYFRHSATVGGNSVTISPVATSSVYRNTDGTGEEKTQYAYTWFTNGTQATAQVQSLTVTAPVISAGQNGPGTADVDTTFFDTLGRPIWHKDADGYIDYTAYDPATSAVVKTITDVDYSKLSTDEQTSFNVTGWSHPTGGLHLVRTIQVDGLGRATQATDPLLHVTYTVYDDPTHQARVYPGWTGSAPTGPTQVVREVRPAASSNNPLFFETLTMSAVPHTTNGVPDGTESIGSLQTLSRTTTNNAGQATEADAYFNLSNLTYSTASVQLGMAGVNYYATQYAYDQRGRRYRLLAPTGTITRTDYDSLSRVSDVQVGTSDANLVMVSQNVYDQDQPNGVGDSNLTQTTTFPGGGAPNRVTQFFYDWRDRQVASKSGVGAMVANEDLVTHRPILVTTYDNLGEAIQQQSYDGDQATVNVTTDASGNTTVSLLVNGMPVTNRLRAQSAASYDDQGRVYQTRTYSVSQSDGTVSSNFLATNVWYSHRGQVLKTVAPGGLVSKTQYDGARRPVVSYTSDDDGVTAWSDANTVASNNVLEQTETQYDNASNPILTVTRQRFHNETLTGVLSDPMGGPMHNQAKARTSYVAAYYDAANRLTDTVDVGTNGGAAYTRPATPPGRSDTVLRTTYGYNSAGWLGLVTDPRTIQAQTTYDNLGRTAQTIEAYTDGIPTPNTNRTTKSTYDGDGNLLTRTALLSATQAQTTQYVYDGGVASLVKSFDLLTKIQYPDKNSGSPSTAPADQESFTYNALGETASFTDRNQTTHTYSYDVLGRMTADAVTITRADVDAAVQRLETAYDTGGRPYLFTSFSAASGGSIVNQVQETYNGLGQLTSEAQAHAGPVVAGTPKVQYAYSEMAGGANHSRWVSMTYPNTAPVRLLSETYGAIGSLDDRISRLTSLSDGTGTLESYAYLGLGDVVQRSYPQPQVNLTYITPGGSGDGGDQYTGLDRFGRVVDQWWAPSGGGTPTDRFLYGYDRNSNRQYRTNEVNHAFDELYHANGVVDTYDGSGNLVATAYDRLNQLGQFARGALNATKDTIASPSRSQNWSLDALGNWSSVSTNGTAQTRGHNQQNQITSISGQGTPIYDNNGNTTTDETGKTLVFDAWNRLVDVKNGSVVVAAYAFDALGRRIVENRGTPTDLYFSTDDQVLEEQQNAVTQAQYVWSEADPQALVERDAGGVRLYVQQDANENVTALVDVNGNVVERYAYDPYGLPLVLNPDFSQRGSSAVNWVYLFQGGRLDPATGQYLFFRRDYSPTLGRWLQVDPIGFAAGDNSFYAFVSNSPTNAIDPSGLDWWWPGRNLYRWWQAKKESQRLDDQLYAVKQQRLATAPQLQAVPSGAGGILRPSDIGTYWGESYQNAGRHGAEALTERLPMQSAETLVVVGAVVLPGPEDAVLGVVMAKYGYRFVKSAGKWVINKTVGKKVVNLTEKELKTLATEYKAAAQKAPESFWTYISKAKGVGRFEFTSGYSSRTLAGEANEVVVYWVVDARTRQILKVGDTTVARAVPRWGQYASKAKAEARVVEIEYVRFSPSAPRHSPSVEDALRREFERQGHKLPWDRERGRNPDLFREAP
jgi:RHS repeat-associated protein